MGTQNLTEKQQSIINGMELLLSKEFSKAPNLDLQFKWLSTKDIARALHIKHRSLRECLTRIYLRGYRTGHIIVVTKKYGNTRLWSLKKIEGYTDSKYEDYVEREYV